MNISKSDDKYRCKMQPDNIGLECAGIKRCKFCGWNPDEAKRRRNQTINRINAKENEK